MPNPYTRVDELQAAARRRVEGPWAGRGAWGLPVVALLALPLLAPTLYAGLVPGAAGAFVVDLVVRLGVLLTGAMALTSYALLVRGPDRGVIDLHPLLPDAWFAARLRRLLAEQAPLLCAALVLLAPALRAGVAPVAPVLAVVGAWFAGIGVGAGVSLAAPRLALDPAWAPVLDALRGSNPRMQAALIWAPGVSVGLAGGAVAGAAVGLDLVTHGSPVGHVLLALPFLVGGAGLRAGRRGAGSVEQLPGLLGEIDAAWAAVESPEERHHVAMDWVARWLPPAWSRDLLRELRHLGRTLRAWQSAAFALVLVFAVAAWAPAGSGAPYLAVCGVGVGIVGGMALRAGAEDPPWLDEILGLGAVRVVVTRALASWLVLQPALVIGGVVGGVRNGARGLADLAASELGAALLVLAASGLGRQWRGRGWVAYVPVVTLVTVGGVAWAR